MTLYEVETWSPRYFIPVEIIMAFACMTLVRIHTREVEASLLVAAYTGWHFVKSEWLAVLVHRMVTPVSTVLRDLTRDCDTVGFVAMDTYCHML